MFIVREDRLESGGTAVRYLLSPLHTKVRYTSMSNLTFANRDEREERVNYWQPASEATGALHNILCFSIAGDSDEKEEDSDDYWHP